MSEEIDKIVEKELKEHQLYGFTLKNFKEESRKQTSFDGNIFLKNFLLDFRFIKDSIQIEVKQYSESLKEMVKNLNPNLVNTIDSLVPAAADDIYKSCSEDINKINKHLEDSMKIKDGVEFLQDLNSRLKEVSASEEALLKNECEQLTHEVLRNEVFIKALSKEIDETDDLLEETEGIENFIKSRLDEQQQNYALAEPLLETLRTLHQFPSPQ